MDQSFSSCPPHIQLCRASIGDAKSDCLEQCTSLSQEDIPALKFVRPVCISAEHRKPSQAGFRDINYDAVQRKVFAWEDLTSTCKARVKRWT